MPRFFIESGAVEDDIITVTDGDATHIGRSLRMKTGEEITFCREGTEYICDIERITPDRVICRVKEKKPSLAEPDITLKIYQALPKQDKPEFIIQKCTELGASEIVFFLSKRCVCRPDEAKSEKRIARFAKIAEEAAKQSGRGRIPIIKGILTFKEAVSELAENEAALICYENGGERFSDIDLKGIRTCGVMIGAEGGFDAAEAEYVKNAGARAVWLGRRILRCETCPVAVSAIIMNLTGNI